MALKDALASFLGKGEQPPLPESFMFGVATADHQCEAYDSKYEDIRDVWERARCPEAARGMATDFWNRYKEDIELAKSLGCNAFRFSIAWSRIEPEPGKFNQAALDHYQDLIEKIISYEMKPVMTLHHFTWPLHVERRGGMIAREFPDLYAGYVTEVVKRFGQDVPYWVTFNEPNLLVGGYIKPWWDNYYAAPPGMPDGTTSSEQVEAEGNLIRNLFLSHKKAYEIIKAENPKAQVGVNQYFYGLPGWVQQIVNRNASSVRDEGDLQVQADRLYQRRALIRGGRIGSLRASSLEQNKVDVVMAALTQTPEREQQVMFSEAYFVTGQQLLAKEGGSSTDNWSNKAIAVIKGSISERNLPLLVPSAQPKVFIDYDTALQALDQGQSDALLADNAILYGLMAQHPGRYMLVGERLTNDEFYAAAVMKGDSGLLDIVDSAVRGFKESPEAAKWKDGYERLTGQQVQEPPKAIRALTMSSKSSVKAKVKTKASQKRAATGPMPKAPEGTALRRIQDRGFVVVAVREDLPGFGFKDPNTGKFSGLEIDLARALALRIFGDAEKVRFHSVMTQERIPLLQPSGFIDWLAKQYTILTTMLMTNWWYMGMANKLDEYLCPEGCAGKLDFVGLDYYWGIPALHPERIQRLMDAAYRRFDQAPVWPGALYDILKDLQGMFPDKPLIIFENGSVEVADGWDKAKYISAHVKEVQRAVHDGMKVDGYICWSLTSNREWDCVFSEASDFGLYHIDLDHDPSLTRHGPTPASDTYQQIIRKRTAWE